MSSLALLYQTSVKFQPFNMSHGRREAQERRGEDAYGIYFSIVYGETNNVAIRQ
jgi:hypothetical protein